MNTDNMTNGSKIYAGDLHSYTAIKDKILKLDFKNNTGTTTRLTLQDFLNTDKWYDDVNPNIIYWDATDTLFVLKDNIDLSNSVNQVALTAVNISTFFDKVQSQDIATETDPIFLAQKGVASGVATLDVNGKIPASQLPTITPTTNVLSYNNANNVLTSTIDGIVSTTTVDMQADDIVLSTLSTNLPASPILAGDNFQVVSEKLQGQIDESKFESYTKIVGNGVNPTIPTANATNAKTKTIYLFNDDVTLTAGIVIENSTVNPLTKFEKDSWLEIVKTGATTFGYYLHDTKDLSIQQEDILQTTVLKANPINSELDALVPLSFDATYTIVNSITELNGDIVETTYQKIAGQTNWQILDKKYLEKIYRGINSAGAEFAPASSSLPGIHGTDYSYDSPASIDFLKTKKHEVLRVPFRWERVQPILNGALNLTEINRIKAFVAKCKTKDIKVILDVHNYARFINSTANGGATLTLGTNLATSSFIDLWVKLSNEFKNETTIYGYGLMNEPHSLQPLSGTGSREEAKVWEKISQEVVTAIRNNDDKQKILVAGFQYSSAKRWAINHPNSWISDPLNNFEYEAHFYFDENNSGEYINNYATINAAAITSGYSNLKERAVDELSNFTNWLKYKNVKGFIGEIGWPSTSDFNVVGEACYELLNINKIGATYWATGERWGATYQLSAYTGTPLIVSNLQATVIEANPTFLAEKNTIVSETDPLFLSSLDNDPLLTANSENKVATQEAVKAYVDSKTGISSYSNVTSSTAIDSSDRSKLVTVTGNSTTVPVVVTLPASIDQKGFIYITRNDYIPNFKVEITTQGTDKIHNTTTFELETGSSLAAVIILIPVTNGYIAVNNSF